MYRYVYIQIHVCVGACMYRYMYVQIHVQMHAYTNTYVCVDKHGWRPEVDLSVPP